MKLYAIRKKNNLDEYSLGPFEEDRSKLGVAKKVRVARSFYSRLMGLMFLEKMKNGV